jgi:hypothetical protein
MFNSVVGVLWNVCTQVGGVYCGFVFLIQNLLVRLALIGAVFFFWGVEGKLPDLPMSGMYFFLFCL